MGDMILWLTLIANPIGAIAIIYVIIRNEALHRLHYILRFFWGAAAIGLLGQSMHSAFWIFTGHASAIDEMMWWAFKDFSLIAFGLYHATKTIRRQ